jgi:flagellar biosynthesis component FlhA
MNKFFIWSCLALMLFSFGSCSTKTSKSSEALDSKNIQLEELRAKSERKEKKSSEVEKVQELNLQQYEAITNYTEIVKGKLNTFVEVKKPAEVRLTILNSKGLLINSFSKKSDAGLNKYQLDFSDLEVGQYYVTLVSKDVYRRFCVAKTQ